MLDAMKCNILGVQYLYHLIYHINSADLFPSISLSGIGNWVL